MYNHNQQNSPQHPHNVMWVVGHEVHIKSEFHLKGMDFTCIDIAAAPKALEKMEPTAITVLYRSGLEEHAKFGEIKDKADNLALPIVLYSVEEDAEAREVATTYQFDDYHFGKLSDNLERKFDMIQKMKEYKDTEEEPVEEPAGVKIPPAKRMFDILVAASALIVLSPLLLLIALIIKLESRGPIFYVSRRAGHNYNVFPFIKFRSMYQDADARLQQLSTHNQYGDGIFIKIKNDPRVTPFGRFLRKTSLDEVPQLINVLKGDMSIVGNRPLPLYEAEQLTQDEVAKRFLAPAGVTGLWQVTKRGKDDMSDEERINLDIEYARKHSMIYDMRLLINTIPAMLQKEAV
ncbi:sugar transferase [Marinoscillum furvescens]|uniref:Lipopolysaccharide/colanic/teichoic acid biosynthesis glycosyltransferase n=1 Tax=Marinoscillum furvescens DSM 4134 TaxID=1122208 RepID=A0A3D9KZD6_MARFU|nr:sugar transferase [Marinoscillum furvescens]RED95652.1 lipopolysaccharide/colanic/teichoic acid biosynthesis glycosyltransferase [Marinoscillum furvescens DSM 4134]